MILVLSEVLEDRVVVLWVLSEVLEDRVVVLWGSSLKTRTTLRSSYTSDKTQRTTEADDKIGPRLRQEQHYDHLTPLTKLYSNDLQIVPQYTEPLFISYWSITLNQTWWSYETIQGSWHF
jgi:hypothetical protein